ncbi:MAG: hypothetical protein Q7R22_005995 [Verrucomicrobiota bacterium JB025]|nr:hypothetical protein [Verrucomicrobiota bacterium JB025]
MNLPTPRQLFSQFERGEIERDELHALMAVHQRELIEEMEEDYQNPAAALIEYLLAKRATGKLVRRHSSRVLREVLIALADVEDFEPSRRLWNAGHPDVPLHSYFRIRREPVFRIGEIRLRGGRVEVDVEHGEAGRGKTEKRRFTLARGEDWLLHVVEG